MAEYRIDHLAACYALSRAMTPAALREVLLANMMGLAQASAGLLLGRADTGEFVDLGSQPTALEIRLPGLPETDVILASSVSLMEAGGNGLAQARIALFDIPGRLLVIPARLAAEPQVDLIFVLLLPLMADPSPDDIAALASFGSFGARMNRLLLQVQTEGVARKDLSRALDHADQDRARVLNKTLPDLLSGRLVGRTQIMQDLRRDITKFGQSRLPVLITGETGTGKELVARELHRISDRGERSFVAVNVAALAADLLESELFGHVRGAFTGATGARKGLIAEADKGTLFLDEIGDMPMSLQAKLLRVIQEKRFRPVGSDKEVGSDFRLISATHRNLDQAIEVGNFRSDLFYRIASVRLCVAPLRERFDDVPSLAAHFLTEIAQRDDKPAKIITPMALDDLRQRDFPGNIRQLQSLIERAAIAAGDIGAIEPAHLDFDMPGNSATPYTGHALLPRLNASDGLADFVDRFERFLILDEFVATGGNRQETADRLGMPLRSLNRKLHADKANDELFSLALRAGLDAGVARGSMPAPLDIKAARDAFERQLILDVHDVTGGNRRRMAEQLRISLGTLADKLKHHDLANAVSLQGQSK